MIEVVRVEFVPFTGYSEIGSIKLQIMKVPIYEAMRGGYLMLSACKSGVIVDFQDRHVALDEIAAKMPEAVKHLEGGNLVSYVDWMATFTDIPKGLSKRITHDHTPFLQENRTNLEHFGTIRFVEDLPLTVQDLFRKLNDPELCAVTPRAQYDDLVTLGIERLHGQWSSNMADRLVRRIARGTEAGDFVRWNDMRTVIYGLKPSLQGTLRSWEDYEQLDLAKIFRPEDFRDKDDIVVAEVLRGQLLNYDAFSKVFCTGGLYDDKVQYLHWNYRFPGQESEKKCIQEWSVIFSHDGPWWSLDISGPRARLQPARGGTVKRLRESLAGTGLPEVTDLPYEITWEKLNDHFHTVLPVGIPTGLDITCRTEMPPLVYLDQVLPISSMPESTLLHTLGLFGITPKGKEKAADRFTELLSSLYPAFEREMLRVLKGKPMILVNPGSTKDLSMAGTIRDIVLPGTEFTQAADYLVAMFLCFHTRGKSIVDADFTSNLYNEKGVFADLVKAGYPPPEASFASGRSRDARRNLAAPTSLCFLCPFGVPEAIDISKLEREDVPAPSPQRAGIAEDEEIGRLLDDL